MGILSLIIKKFSSDKRGAVRAANVAKRVDGKVDDLLKAEKNIEIVANTINPNRKKIEKVLRKHAKLVGEIATGLKQIIEFEFTSYQLDTNEPLKIVRDFIKVIKRHKEDINDPELKRILTALLREIGKKHGELFREVKRSVSEVNEVFAREIVGARSAYSVSKGDLGRMALLIEARELEHKKFDSNVNGILRDLKQGIDKVENFLKNKGKPNMIGSRQLEQAFFNENKWVRSGNEEFRRAKNGRWMVRNVGVKGGGGFASKQELVEKGILYYELLQALRLFNDHFKTLIDYLLKRAELSKQVIGHAGYMDHKIAHALDRVKADVVKYVSGDKKLVAELRLIEKKEAQDVREAEKVSLAEGQHTLATAKAAEGRISKLIAVGVAGVLAGGIGGAALDQVRDAQAGTANKTAVARREIVVADVIMNDAKAHFKKSLLGEVHLKFDKSDFAHALDKKEFEVKLLSFLVAASQHAGYGSDYRKFVKDQKIVIPTEGIIGLAGLKGNERYNLKLSQRRMAAAENYLANLSKRIGVPFVIESSVGKGETGEKEFLAVIDSLIKKGKGDSIVAEAREHLDLQGSRTLKYWYKWYKKYKKPKKKAFALENLLTAVHKIAALDSLLLAPHRKVVFKFSIEYDVPTKGPQTVGKLVVVDDPVITTVIAAPQIFSEKAILTSHDIAFTRTEEAVVAGAIHGRGRVIAAARKNRPRAKQLVKGRGLSKPGRIKL